MVCVLFGDLAISTSLLFFFFTHIEFVLYG